MRRLLVSILALFVAGAALAQDSNCITKVGEDVVKAVETTHPVPRAEKGQAIWREEFSKAGASYIAVHFAAFDLAQGERVVVSSPDGKFAYAFEGRGRSASGTFWATHIPGDTAIVTYYAGDSGPGWGFSIDKFARGYPIDQWPNLTSGATEGVCGGEDSINAVCYQVSEPDVYTNSKAVARLLSGGSALCTAWLVGCDGHVMTNNHCLATQADVDSADFEFMAEGATCGANCTTSPYCPGTVWEPATPGTFVQTNYNADYTLVKLPSNGSGQKPSDVYGFFRLRDALPTIDERIYLPGHPAGWGKRIAVTSDAASDQSGFCEIATLDYEQCQGTGGPLDISYYADTQGGSSGSPVVAYSDHRVVAIHHCNAGGGACPNRGVPMNFIIADLQASGNLPICAIQQYAGTVEFDANSYICDDIVSIKVKDDNLVGQPSQAVTIVSTTEATPETVTLIPLPAPNDNTFIGSIPMAPTPPVAADGTLSVTNGDTITVTYIDLDDGLGGVNIPRTDTAGVDCVAPIITDVNATNVTGSSAQINWLTNEPATSIVRYGLVTPPGATSSNGALVTTHGWTITGLTECSSYYYEVASQDDAGNYVSDNNAGAYYGFITLVNVTPTYAYAGPPVAIPDSTTVTASFVVADTRLIQDINVKIGNITHTYDADLDIFLIAPNGTRVELSTDNGAGGDNFIDTVFDDAAATSITTGVAPMTGEFQPEGLLSTLNGIPANGTWTLEVSDDAGIDTGTLNAWEIQLSFPPEQCPTVGQVTLDDTSYQCAETVQIQVVDFSILGAGTQAVSIASGTEPGGETIVLNETPANSGSFLGSIPLTTAAASGGDGFLSIADGDTITVTYIDADDGYGGLNIPRTDSAVIDCGGPAISNVQAINVSGRDADITWDTGELADSEVFFGAGPPPVSTVSSAAFVTGHSLHLSGLVPCTTYVFYVRSTDVTANSSVDDNGGIYFSFTTTADTQPIFTYSGAAVPIPDNSPAGATADIVVTDVREMLDVDVLINIAHVNVGDLQISLIGPNAVEIPLALRRGGTGDNFTNTIFDDAAAGPISGGVAPFTGSFKPEGSLSVLNGLLSNGTWTLKVKDVVAANVGTITSWQLRPTFTAIACNTPFVQEASHSVADSCGGGGSNAIVDPGEDLTIPLQVANTGYAGATGVVATLSTATPDVVILDGSTDYGSLPLGAFSSGDAPFLVSIGSTVPCGTLITFDLAVTANEGSWNDSFTVRVGNQPISTNTFPSTDTPKPIPDVRTPPVLSSIVVASAGLVSDVNVTINLNHTFDADLDIFLIGPNGTRVELSTDNGSSGDNFLNTVFDDQAAASITTGVAPFTGSFKPEGLLSSLNGISAAGTWTLEITDDLGGDFGTLNSWSVTITNPAGAYLCTACNLAPPGEATDLLFTTKTDVSWSAAAGAAGYYLYRGELADLPSLLDATNDSCQAGVTNGLSMAGIADPAADVLHWYLVRGWNTGGYGGPGAGTAGPRVHDSSGTCP